MFHRHTKHARKWAVFLGVFAIIMSQGCKKDSGGGSAAAEPPPPNNPPPPECIPLDANGTSSPILTVQETNLDFGDSTPTQVTGGLAPLNYAVVSGGGMVTASGVFRAVGSGTSVVRVRDSACRSSTVSITVAPPVVSSLTPNDTLFGQLWGFSSMQATQAWGIKTDCSSVIVGVVDTGVDYQHEDLLGNRWINSGEIAADGIDNDGNGYIDDVYGWDFTSNGDNNPMDEHGHGTHVAGTIAGVGNNGKGVSGVCWTARVAALKFLDSSGSGATSDAVEAIHYARVNGFKVLNNSWGGSTYNQSLKDAIDQASQAGVLFVAAAGNDGRNNDTQPTYPAGYGSPNIISVAASDQLDRLTSFSNFGPFTVHLAAPGLSIKSTYLGDQYVTNSGTSMASPHVAGAAALLWSWDPYLTMDQVKQRLMQTVDRPAPLAGKLMTAGRLNLHRALNPGVP